MRKRMIFTALFFILAIFIISIYNYPLRQDEDVICENIQAKIPLGTSFADVRKLIDSERKWIINTIYVGDGNFVNGYDIDGYHKERFSSITKGELISVNIGKYSGFIFRTDVLVDFVFDKNYKLIDIEVSKYTDSL